MGWPVLIDPVRLLDDSHLFEDIDLEVGRTAIQLLAEEIDDDVRYEAFAFIPARCIKPFVRFRDA